MKRNSNEISIKITEMMITIGGVAGAILFNTTTNKELYTLSYVFFLLFSFVVYAHLLQNKETSMINVLSAFLSSFLFGIVLLAFGDFFEDVWNLIGLFLLGVTLSKLQIMGFSKRKKPDLIQKIIYWFD